jgi:chemotaxis protein CheD
MSDEAGACHVYMGEVALATPGVVLKATLGSCVGIALIWPARQRFALAHCLLPWAPEASTDTSARYVDQGIWALLRLLQVQPADHAELEAHLAGGASMYRRAPLAAPSPQVGQLNAEAAQAVLVHHGIRVLSRDLGGTVARQVCLDGRTGAYQVSHVPSPFRSQGQGMLKGPG